MPGDGPSVERAYLVRVERRRRPVPGAPQPPDLLGELRSLVASAGAVVVGEKLQHVVSENPATLLGKGALEALKADVGDGKADVVVFQNLLRPKQQALLEEETGVKVLDRREIILDIFAQRARTREGKLQVELAQLAFRLGRLAGGRRDLSRLGGGIGTRGPGEKKLEVDRRKIRTGIRQIEKELGTVRRTRALHYHRRRETGFPVVAIVGYTNAGKSTLFNRLTGADVFVADKLFATLDPTARKLRLPSGREAIVVDTVGFIHELPKELRDAFLATLEGIGEADLLLHVVDGASADMEENTRSVVRTLEELGYGTKPVLLAVNKSDRGTFPPRLAEGEFRISALTGEGVGDMIRIMEERLWPPPGQNASTRPD